MPPREDNSGASSGDISATNGTHSPPIATGDMRGGTLIGTRLYKGVPDRVSVRYKIHEVPTQAPLAAKLTPLFGPTPTATATAGEVAYYRRLESLEERILGGMYGKETAPRSTEGALFLDSDTGEPEVRKLDPTMLADMGLPPPPRKYTNAWCCPFADPKNGYACTPLTVKQGGYAARARPCQPNRGALQKAVVVRHLATAHKCGAGMKKRGNSGAYLAYAEYNREAGFAFVVHS